VSNPTGGMYMTVQHSFSKIEKELLPAFRQQIGAAESTEDVKKFFVHTISELVNKATDGEINLIFEDIRLNHTTDSDCCKFIFSDTLVNDSTFSSLWKNSDLSNIIDRFASSACNRYTHLQET
jgi:hypothetical protein